jgi:tripartite-type tricarboxylate transporter receptor subunit TctC
MNLLRSCAILLCCITPLAFGQGYPSKPVTIVVGFAPGGLADTLARALADFARTSRGATVVVENRPGASATIATDRVAKSAPDGYTLTLTSPSPIWVVPNVEKQAYEPLKDLVYIAQLVSQPLPIYVRSDSPFKTYEDFLAHARGNPGKVRWGTAGARGFAEIVVSSALRHEKVDTISVPYKGGAEAVTALLGGHIEAVASTDFGPQLQAGKVRLLVETGPTRAPGHEHLKTFGELGYPISAPVFYGLMGPARMPPEAVKWWEAVARELAASPSFATLVQTQAGIVSYSGSAEFTASVRRGYDGFAKALGSTQ